MCRRCLTVKLIISGLLILLVPSLAAAQVSHAPLPPEAFQRAMVFVDGTNLFYRLESLKLIVPSFIALLKLCTGRRDLLRAYLYTIREHYEAKGVAIHGTDAFNQIRLVFGEGVPTNDGNVREKGVDALLVSDLIYHAAHKNIDYALVVSVDADFSRAIQRVERLWLSDRCLGSGFAGARIVACCV